MALGVLVDDLEKHSDRSSGMRSGATLHGSAAFDSWMSSARIVLQRKPASLGHVVLPNHLPGAGSPCRPLRSPLRRPALERLGQALDLPSFLRGLARGPRGWAFDQQADDQARHTAQRL